MNITFRPDELITKKGKSYPVVGARLRVAHEENQLLEISTDLVSFETLDQAVVKALVKTDRGAFTAFGVASASKDTQLIDSLLELAETRAIARALRFAGYGVEYTSLEEIGDNSPICELQNKLSKTQRKAIEQIACSQNWNVIEACKRITQRFDITSLNDISKEEAILIISKFKEQAAA